MSASGSGQPHPNRGLPVVAVVLVAATLLAGLVAGLSTSSGAVPPIPVHKPEHYVALGDSFAAGPWIPEATGVPVTCGRSTANYPSVVRDRLRARSALASFADLSCGGATTADMTTPQPTPAGVNPPQLDALTRDTTLVTLTLGGNDIGFTEIVDQCLARSASQPNGAACRAYYQRAGRDLLADRIAATAPKLAGVLSGVKSRAPAARVLVVGYPTIVPALSGCPQAPFSAGDIAYLNQTFHALDAMIAQQAQAAGVQFVDTARDSAGHDVCAPPGTRWVEGRQPSAPALPFHPNALGMRKVAQEVLDAVLVA